MTMTETTVSHPSPRTPQGGRGLLVVDDDDIFRERLCRALERRGFQAMGAASVEDAENLARSQPVDYAVIDLKLGSTSGLDLVPMLRESHPDCRVVMLTGYGNIATAVAAIKVGAVDYLAKPADADDIEAALLAKKDDKPPRRPIPCRPTGCAGSISSGSTSCATETSRKPPAASTCTAGPCNGSWRSIHRGNQARPSLRTK